MRSRIHRMQVGTGEMRRCELIVIYRDNVESLAFLESKFKFGMYVTRVFLI